MNDHLDPEQVARAASREDDARTQPERAAQGPRRDTALRARCRCRAAED